MRAQALGTLVVTLSLLSWTAPVLGSSRCTNQITDESLSPDGRLKAVVFVRGCSDPARFSTQVSVIKSGKPLANVAGNIFVSGVRTEDEEVTINVSAVWENHDRLIVTYPPGTEVLMARTAYKGIEIVFKSAT